jgi:hypothetical protein
MSSGPIISNSITNSCPVRIENIPIPDNSVLYDFSWNINQILTELFKNNFHLPPESTLSIFYENENRMSGLLIKNPKFSIKIRFAMQSAGSGMHQRNPYYEALISQDIFKGHEVSIQNYFHLDAVGYLEASFDYPEYDMDEFDKYYHYYQSIKELLDDYWNYDLLLKKLPSKDLIILNDKLDQLLNRK